MRTEIYRMKNKPKKKAYSTYARTENENSSISWALLLRILL